MAEKDEKTSKPLPLPKNQGMTIQSPSRSPDAGRPLPNSFNTQKKVNYGIGYGFYHAHNGTDGSPQIPFGNLINTSRYVSQQIAVYATGTTAVSVFGGYALLSGHITSVGVVSNNSSGGTVTVVGKTAGTIAVVGYSTVPGTISYPATNIYAVVKKGDFLTVTPTQGSVTCLITMTNET